MAGNLSISIGVAMLPAGFILAALELRSGKQMPLLLPSEYSPEALRADLTVARAARNQVQMQLISLQEGLNLSRVSALKNPTQKSYRVGQFETLPQVSTMMYGAPDHWPEIAAANNLEYPYIIVPGQVLNIPTITTDG